MHVNLWELITTVAGSDVSNSERCQALKAMKGPRFGSELSLEITENGTWVIEVYDHLDDDNRVNLSIHPSGALTVTRCRQSGDTFEKRTFSF